MTHYEIVRIYQHYFIAGMTTYHDGGQVSVEVWVQPLALLGRVLLWGSI